MRRRLIIAILTIVIVIPLYGNKDEEDFIKNVMKQEELKLKERIEKIKNQKDSLYFANTPLRLHEQQKHAKKEIEKIKKLSEVDGFDIPDHKLIYEHIKALLTHAPDTMYAKMAHWEIHRYFLGLLSEKEDYTAASKALETFIAKYQVDELRLREAYDKLSSFASRMNKPARSLYYSEKYLQLNPDNYALLYAKAKALYDLGQTQHARKIFLRIVDERPNSVQGNLSMDMLDKMVRETKINPELLHYKKTLASLKLLSTGLEVWYLDNAAYPDKLETLVPKYIQEGTPLTDSWGHKILFILSEDKTTYWLASTGSDGIFQGWEQVGTHEAKNGEDIIVKDGKFLYYPKSLGY